MSRRYPRVRTRLAATVSVADDGRLIACPTRNVSINGCFLDTSEVIQIGVRLSIAVMDTQRGEAVEVEGVVTRVVEADAGGVGGGIGVRLIDPGEDWTLMVRRYQGELSGRTEKPGIRLRVLVVGDGEHRRGALALYVTSGWDVRFASDLRGAEEALDGVKLSAVIAEHELDDPRWPEILGAAKRIQPKARRIVRCPLRGHPAPTTDPTRDLVHRVVDLDAGLDALLDALTAEMS